MGAQEDPGVEPPSRGTSGGRGGFVQSPLTYLDLRRRRFVGGDCIDDVGLKLRSLLFCPLERLSRGGDCPEGASESHLQRLGVSKLRPHCIDLEVQPCHDVRAQWVCCQWGARRQQRIELGLELFNCTKPHCGYVGGRRRC